MTGTKHLPEFVHQYLMNIDDTWGASKAFREKANIHHATFKRLVETGYGRACMVQRVIAAYEADKKPVEITADKVLMVVGRYREQIAGSVTSARELDALLRQISAWVLHEQEFGRKRIAAALGYKSISAVNHARQTVQNEAEFRRDKQRLATG